MNVNVYEEIGSPNAKDMFLKARLVSFIGDIMRNTGMTQIQLANLAGLTQPQVSNILKGRFRDISLEKLIRILTALHHNVRISVDPTPSDAADVYLDIGNAQDAAAPEKELVPA